MTREEALREIELSRAAIARDYRSVRDAANFKARAKASIVRRPVPWLGGAAALGWIFAGRRRRKRNKSAKGRGAKQTDPSKETVKSLGIFTLLLSLVKISLPLWRPLVTSLATKKLADLAFKLK